MRRFIICSLLVVTAVTTAMACGPWGRPNYYMFSVFNRNQMGETYTKGLLNYWRQYCADQALGAYDIAGLAYVAPDELDTSDNPLVASARQKNDREMLDYLRLLCSYLHVSEEVQGDTWSYPTKQDLQRRGTHMDYLYNRARSYTGSRLSPQYELLAMRALMIKQDYATIIQRWLTRSNKLPESVFKDMSRGIYAHALLKTGKQREACEIYAELGDMRSIKWVMRDKRNLQGIKDEYKANPNSPTLVYLVQDYVNNAQSSIEGLASARQSLSEGYTYDGFADEVRQIEATVNGLSDFVPFARQVVKEKKTQVPTLWMSAAGHLQALLGNSSEAIALLDKSLKMKGTRRMLDNARVCRLMATVPTAQATRQYKDYLLGELQWLTRIEQEEKDESLRYGNTENHYSEMLENLCYDYLYPQFTGLGEHNLATALVGWCDGHERALYDDEYWVSSFDYFSAIDSLTARQMIDYRQFLSNPDGKLEQFLVTGIDSKKNSDQYFSERIGTKLIREGRFAEAIPWLEQVSTDYIGTQAISAYMAHRTYTKQQWFERQRGVTEGEQPTPVTQNQKLAYARDMVRAIERVNATSGIEQAQAKYDLAAMYFEGSYKGNCWYLTRYGNSVGDNGPVYADEKDFVAEAVRLLEEAAGQSVGDFDLQQRCLYANAYIPLGAPYITYDYDSDYNQIERRNPASHEYVALRSLEKFYTAHRSRVASYVSRCDILKQFMANNH